MSKINKLIILMLLQVTNLNNNPLNNKTYKQIFYFIVF